MGKTLILITLVAVGLGAWYVTISSNSPKAPKLDPYEWWGPNELKGKVDNSIRPFQINFDERLIEDLRARLQSHRPFTPALEGIGFEYGINSKTLDTWVKYWAEKYPFAEREKFLNQFPQFKTSIQGLDIHFIRVKPEVPQGVKVLPLLLLHGWPGSVREFYEAIPLLTRQTPGYDFAFEVIVPSLPGYGFSDGAVRPGMAAPQVAMIFKNLMNRLGFKKFYIQGGDWGAVIASSLATLFPDQVLGHHNNMAFVQSKINYLKLLLGSLFPSLVVESSLADRMYPLFGKFAFAMEEFGYFHIQATKPDTVGVALTDSPSGLLAYILEKFSTWTCVEFRPKVDGGLETHYTKDQLLDNIMIYWTSKSITTSMRLYAELMSNKHRELELDEVKTPVPTWALQTKYEPFYQPPNFLRSKYTNLLNTTVLDNGGHFAALELPKVFTEDVFRAVKAFRQFRIKNERTEL